MIELTNRLQMIANAHNRKSVADIGTDHAHIPIYLMENKLAKKVIATDVRKGPAHIAEQNIKKHGVDVRVRIGNGLSCINVGEVEEIIIAGMGGLMIISILQSSPEFRDNTRFILQPMNNQCELRHYLVNNGYNVSHEGLSTEEHHVYNMIITDSQSANSVSYQNEFDYQLPPVLFQNPYFKDLLAKKKREFTKMYNGIKKSNTQCDNDLSWAEDMLSYIESLK